MTDNRYGTSICRTCGAEFASSPSGATVNCPAHRSGAADKAKRAAEAAQVKAAHRIGVRQGGEIVAEFAPATGEVFIGGRAVGHAKSPAGAIAYVRAAR